MADADEVAGRPSELEAPSLAGAAPALDGFEKDKARTALREKMFGAKPDEVRIGRFVVIKRVGAGGMGVVYAAYDSELDRKVAIKLIRPETIQAAQAQQRLLREARAMAKLSHSNVVQIYDVGTHDGQVYIAMEYVDGQTLGDWLEHEPPRELHDIIPMFLAAGRGLAAAHEAGLVHRDFKPANVLVGNDGSVRVVDFGLARPVTDEPEVPSGAPLVDSQSPSISRTGAIMGTPAYMSPEQHLAHEVDARTDQFSYCVALHEALYGERPFAGDSLAQLSLAVTSGVIRTPPKIRPVPDWLHDVLLRGLSSDPKDRHPSMDALLAALSRDPTARRKRIIAGTGFGIALVASIAGAYVLGENDLEACTGAEQRLVGIWDQARKSQIETALLGTELPLAADTAARVGATLDEYAQSWASQHQTACEATQLGEQSQAMLDLRMRCLERRLGELDALVDVLAQADAKVVGSAAEAATHLPRLEQCADLEALAAEVKPPADPRVAAAVESVRSTLAQSRALEGGGKYQDALDVTESALASAEPLDYPPLAAEILLRKGELEIALDRHKDAHQTLSEAYWAAMGAEHDRAAANAASMAVRALGRLGRYDEGLNWVRHAQAVITRIRHAEAEEARLLESWGELLDEQNEYEEAREHLERAISIQTELRGPNHPVVASTLHQLGKVVFHQGDYTNARDYFERALTIQEKALGPNHPALGRILPALGSALKNEGQYGEARRVFERSLAIQEAAFGPEYSGLARDLNNLGNLFRRLGELDKAKTMHERALHIREKAYDGKHPLVARSISNLALVYEATRELSTARELHERALRMREETQGLEHQSVANSLNNIGGIAYLQGDHSTALDHHRRAHAIRKRILDESHPEVAWGLVQLAKTELALEKADLALARVRKALRTFEERPDTAAERVAEARFTLARALWARNEGRASTRNLAEQARLGFAKAGPQSQRDLEEVEAWLKEHSADR